METKKVILLRSILRFLNNELASPILDEDSKETLEVSIQCLGNAFNLEQYPESNEVELLSLIDSAHKIISEEDKKMAEAYKTSGNDCMKSLEYNDAIYQYSKAIELDPYNAVYYCNRAAAYTKLQLDSNAVVDCNEAIKLDPNYSKAYGRLGIAYSNMNKYELACEAYKTALKFDPGNISYETNLKLAEGRLKTPDAATNLNYPDLSRLLQNPNVFNMASQVLNDPNFCNLISGILNTNSTETLPNVVETIREAGHTLVQRVVTEDPELYNTLLRNFQENAQAPAGDEQQAQTKQEKKDEDGNDNQSK